LYTGFTSDLERRLRQHQTGRASKYTRSRLPVRLVFLERCPSKSASLRREAVIKSMTRGEKLKLCASLQSFEGRGGKESDGSPRLRNRHLGYRSCISGSASYFHTT